MHDTSAVSLNLKKWRHELQSIHDSEEIEKIMDQLQQIQRNIHCAIRKINNKKLEKKREIMHCISNKRSHVQSR